MAEPTRARRLALLLVVLGVIAALGGMLLVGLVLGDETDQVDPQNGKVVTVFRR